MGTGDGIAYDGGSCFIGPFGETIAEAGDEETVLFAELGPEHVAAVKGPVPLPRGPLVLASLSCATSERNQEWSNMKALVKARPEAGLSYEDVPVPAIGRGDVLIKVLRTGICGTDLHIYAWDAWARRNVPVPLIVGHEFVGQIVELGVDVDDLEVGDLVSGEGHLVCGRCRNCIAGRRVQCAQTKGIGVNHPGAFAEYIALPATNVWRHMAGHRPRRGGYLRPVRQRRAHRAHLPGPRRGRAHHRGRPDRDHGGHRRPSRRRPLRRHHRRLRLPARAGPFRGLDARRRRRRHRRSPTRMAELGMREGFDVGFEMSGRASALQDMLANMAHGGKIAMLGPADARTSGSTGRTWS